MRRLGLLTLALCAVLLGPREAVAQEITGRVENYAGATFSEGRWLLARSRADLRVAYDYDRGRVVIAPRLTFNALDESLSADLREAYADVYFDRADIRLGTQFVTWGRMDGAFVTDLLTPFDLTSFLSQPYEDLREGLTAARVEVFLGDETTLEAVGVPIRPTSRLPGDGSPWFPAPSSVLGVPVRLTDPDPIEPTFEASETALRLTWRGLPRTDLAVLWVNGFNRLPAFRKDLVLRLDGPALAIELTPTYRRRQVIGLTAETLAADPFVLRAEAAFHTRYLLDQRVELPDSPDDLFDPDFQDAVARGFLIEKPFLDTALGVQRAFGGHTLGVQLLGRLVLDYDERVAPDRFEPAVTGLWLTSFFRDTVTLRAFGLYNLGKDFWVNPELTYAVQDGLNASVGFQVFGGPQPDDQALGALLREPTFRFSAFRDNAFGYVRVTYGF